MLVSIVIRSLNEGRHLDDLLVMIEQQNCQGFELETVVIDSGSTDNTLDIARSHGVRVTTIQKEDFSFGRSLNLGCKYANGEILVFISGHCVPANSYWLQNLCRPLLDSSVSYSYGRQIGDDESNFSERLIFSKYFPDRSAIPQEGFFCNNANSALLRSTWQKFPFDEELTGLEDMELAKRLVAQGMQVGYVADAVVFHHHNESWTQIRHRFEREALALRIIMPEVHLSWLDVIRCVIVSTYCDWRAARLNGVTSTSKINMLRYRWNQYLGSFKGNTEHRCLSRKAKEKFFYPHLQDKAEQDESLRPVRRTSPNKS
ncbi:glycosyltransferase [Yoonia vestfoldensis]|uniref:Putative glycosyl transferase n=1 Tax=Yoonia vestfoldensis TaxID=245188 RepID=A0A1Y0EBA1_9RHOB|nr:glycosyltransferase [Yoonia vestfoldensis]ARU00896.1 putative glycosyl transferase [Yoonia vestfoldensis]